LLGGLALLLRRPGLRHSELTGSARLPLPADGRYPYGTRHPRACMPLLWAGGRLCECSHRRTTVPVRRGGVLIDHDWPEVDALRDQAQVLRARLEEIAREFADDPAMPVTMARTMTERVQAKLGDIEAQLADAGKVSVLGGLIGLTMCALCGRARRRPAPGRDRRVDEHHPPFHPAGATYRLLALHASR
jgi:hypothetical protein